MSRPLAFVTAMALATACATDPIAAPSSAATPAPRAASGPDAPSAFLSIYGYQASLLPLDFGAAINASGAIVGTIGGTPNGTGVYYANGVTTPLAVLLPYTSVTPVGITDDGRIFAQGWAPTMGLSTVLLYTSPTAPPSNIAAPSWFWTEPSAVSNRGVVVGRFEPHAGGWGAFRWSPDSGYVDITPRGFGQAWPTAISTSGYATGVVSSSTSVGTMRWNPTGAGGPMIPFPIHALQPLDDGRVLVHDPTVGSAIWAPGNSLTPVGPDPTHLFVAKISANGRYVGTFKDATGQLHAWTSIGTSAATTLPIPSGFASAWVIDVNGCGTILGLVGDSANTHSKPVVWKRPFTCDLGTTQTAP